MAAGLKVLLVDDEAEFADVLAERLVSRGLDATAVYDGDSALERVRRDPPAVMVLDLKMPGTDGFEVLRRLGALGAPTQVIVLTGHASGDDRDLVLRLGACEFFNKPLEFGRLQRAIERAARIAEAAGSASADPGRD